MFEVSLEIWAGSGCARTGGMTGEGKSAPEGKLTVPGPKSARVTQADTARHSAEAPGQPGTCLPGFLHPRIRGAAEGYIEEMNPRISGEKVLDLRTCSNCSQTLDSQAPVPF